MYNTGFALITGLSIGLLGGFHCIGMCGPIALALPIHRLSSFAKVTSVLLYNVGRACSYAMMGLLFGLIGQGFSFFKIQQYLSIFAGLLILFLLLISHFNVFPQSGISQFTIQIKNKLGQSLKADKTSRSYFSIGILNGFLPCGLVYVALATALATGSMYHSALLMFAFGLGTLPIMALTMGLGKFISISFRSTLRKISPYLIAGMASLLIIRGLNLGIPYLSPIHDAQHQSCCHKQ